MNDLPFSTACVVLPTYNEAGNLPPMVAAIRQHGDFGILVVDDNSPDGTGRIADELAAATPRMHVLHRETKQGLGPAYLAGFARATELGYRFVFQMDADFQHDPAELPNLLATACGPDNNPDGSAGGADLVLGSRYVRGGRIPDWAWHRRLISWAGNTFARIGCGFRIHDYTTGFRCIRVEQLHQLDLQRVRASGYSFLIELAAAFGISGMRVREIPIAFGVRLHGESKMSLRIALEALRTVMRVFARRLLWRNYRKR